MDNITVVESFVFNQARDADDTLVPDYPADVSSVAIFEATFQEEVRTCIILREVFDFSRINPAEFGKRVYPYILSTHKKLKLLNALQAAQSCVHPITKYQKKLNRSILARIYANTVAKLAFVTGVLDEENAEDLALSFASLIRENARRFKKAGNRDWKVKSLAQGLEDFLRSCNILTRKNIPLLDLIFANEWIEAGSS
ncbi:hypothetical protein TNCV_190181 [Trichonephila clavipes]|nr:hypothetical protein TNCV_190181 [Trichonephila clavipes]